MEPWLAEENIIGGQDWQSEIAKAIRSADVVLICLSSRSTFKRGFIQKEIRHALEIAEEQPEGIPFLLPLRLDPCELPSRLKRWQWIDLFDEVGFDKLVRALDLRAKSVVQDASAETVLKGNGETSGIPAPEQFKHIRKERRLLITKPILIVVGLALGAILIVSRSENFWKWVRTTLIHKPPTSNASKKPVEVRPLTQENGKAMFPSLSPDGNDVLFSWIGYNSEANYKIYIKGINSIEKSRLLKSDKSANEVLEISPSWAPNGKEIAFVRESREARTVIITDKFGSYERELTTIQGRYLTWVPRRDALVLAVIDKRNDSPYGIYLIDVETGKRTFLVELKDSKECKSLLAFSNDLKWLAYINSCSLYLAHLDSSNMIPALIGTPQRIVDGKELWGLAWMPDNKTVVFSGTSSNNRLPLTLQKVNIETNEIVPENIEGPGLGTSYPTISSSIPTTIAFVQESGAVNIVRVSRKSPNSGERVLLSPSSGYNLSPQLSPDEKRIAFSSQRFGTWEIYTCNTDGTDLKQLTYDGRPKGSPQWSPDGSKIAFDSLDRLGEGGNRDIFAVGADGSNLEQITTEASEEARPFWSRDGKRIYFRSNRTGQTEIWQIRMDTKEVQQLTFSGGYDAVEARDGKSLFFSRKRDKERICFGGGLWRKDLGTGAEQVINSTILQGQWGVFERGIYFVDFIGSPIGADKKIRLIEFSNMKKVKDTGISVTNSDCFNIGLTATRDGQHIFLVEENQLANLAFISNFK